MVLVKCKCGQSVMAFKMLSSEQIESYEAECCSKSETAAPKTEEAPQAAAPKEEAAPEPTKRRPKKTAAKSAQE